MSPISSREIKEQAHALGFDPVGIVPATVLTAEGAHLREWLERNLHGRMDYLARHAEMRIDPDQLMQEPICIGLRKSDVDTLNFLNNWIAAARSKGWIDERHRYWFESTQWQALVQ